MSDDGIEEDIVEEYESREDDVRNTFSKFDKDKSGDIDARELAALFRDLGIAKGHGRASFDELLDTEFAIADVNRDGRITFAEFAGYYNRVIDLTTKAKDTKGKQVDSLTKLRERGVVASAEDLAATFKKYEASAGGKIDRAKFKEVLSDFLKADAADPILEHVFSVFDVDGSGHIDMQEFAAALCHLFNPSPEEKLEVLFGVYDRGNSGFITSEAIQKIFESSLAHIEDDYERELMAEETETWVEGIMESLDANNDGKLSLEECKAAMRNNPKVLECFSASLA